MNDAFESYLHSLRQDRDDKTELSDRGALETLLNAAAKEANPAIRIIHEAKKVRGKGGPDFKVMKDGMILGYVEDKTIGTYPRSGCEVRPDRSLQAAFNNILLTDYLQFLWLKDGKSQGARTIAFPHDLEGKAKSRARIASRQSRRCCADFSQPRQKGLVGSEQLALGAGDARPFSCATFSIRSCAARKKNTGKGSSMASMRSFAIRSSTN